MAAVTGDIGTAGDIVVTRPGVCIGAPAAVTALAIFHHSDIAVAALTIGELRILSTNGDVVSISGIAFVTGHTTGGTFGRHNDTGVTAVAVDVIGRIGCEAVMITTWTIDPIGVTAFAVSHHRQRNVASLTIFSDGSDIVVLSAGRTFNPEAGIVTGEAVVLRIDGGVATGAEAQIAVGNAVVIGFGIDSPAAGVVTAFTAADLRQVSVTGLTAQLGVDRQLIVVRLTWRKSVAAFALGVLIAADGAVTTGTGNAGTRQTDHVVVLADGAADTPEISVVTGLTAVLGDQGVVTDRAIEILIHPHAVVVLVNRRTLNPAGRGVAIFAAVNIGAGTVTDAAVHAELDHGVVTGAGVAAHVAAVTVGNRGHVQVTGVTVGAIGNAHDIVVLFFSAAGAAVLSPETGIVTGEAVVLRIDGGVATGAEAQIAVGNAVVIGFGIDSPAAGVVTAFTAADLRQVSVTGLTAQLGVDRQLIVVRLTWRKSVAAFALGVLIAADGAVTTGTGNAGTRQTDHVVVLADGAADTPEISVVTGLTAVLGDQGVVTDRAIEILIHPHAVVVLVNRRTLNPAGRGVAIFAAVNIGAGTVTDAAVHAELDHGVVTGAGVAAHVAAVTIGNRSHVQVTGVTVERLGNPDFGMVLV